MSKSGIYQIRNRDSGAVYIGSAVSLADRKATHWWALRNRRHFNSRLQRAWVKHGEESFVFERLLIDVPVYDLITAEQRELDTARLLSRKLYNIRQTANSNQGLRLSDGAKRKLSNHFCGRIISEFSANGLGQQSSVSQQGRWLKASKIRSVSRDSVSSRGIKA